MTIPLQTTTSLTICLILGALAGLFGMVLAGRRMNRMTGYHPGVDDWSWHVVLPGVGYALLFAAALLLSSATHLAELLVASVAMALLAIGIHNAWDVGVYIVAMSLPPAATHTESTAHAEPPAARTAPAPPPAPEPEASDDPYKPEPS
jgi:hypothetical protein